MHYHDGDYSIFATEKAALLKNCSFQRMDVALRALADGAALQALDDQSLQQFYSVVCGLFGVDEKPALILRTKKYHYVALHFKQNDILLLDSQRASPLSLSLRGGLHFIQ